ncbi:hypothetical protein ACFO3J_15370 [Streptomyces polygonati]|uniref:Uncharacterized protein n=1 Tax=Streptomyces polygonati TaxID=1617087 RepID=A0ABV8HLG5_9ACTN
MTVAPEDMLIAENVLRMTLMGLFSLKRANGSARATGSHGKNVVSDTAHIEHMVHIARDARGTSVTRISCISCIARMTFVS